MLLIKLRLLNSCVTIGMSSKVTSVAAPWFCLKLEIPRLLEITVNGKLPVT